MSRTLRKHDIQVLMSIQRGENRHYQLASIFDDNDGGFSYNLLKTLAQLKQAGIVKSIERSNYIEWGLTTYARELI